MLPRPDALPLAAALAQAVPLPPKLSACGVLLTQNEKDQADLAYLKTFRKDAGFALSAAEESELQHNVAQEKYFDARYILISQATIHIGGMVMQSDVTIYYRHINAWGRGNPPMKKST